MSKLLAYTIGGQKIGIDIKSWNAAMLSGNTAFIVIADTGSTPTNYTNISSVDNWNNFGNSAGQTDAVVKNEIIKLIPGTPTLAQYAILENYMNVGVNSMTKVNGTTILGSAPVNTTSLTGVTDNNFKITGGTITGNLKINGTTCLGSLSTGSISTDKTLFLNPSTCAISAIKLTGGSDTYLYVENTVAGATSSTSCATSAKYLGLTGTSLSAGRYNVQFTGQFGATTAQRCAMVIFNIDNVVQGTCYLVTGQATGADSAALNRDVTLTAGTHCFDIRYWGSATCANMYWGSISVKKIC